MGSIEELDIQSFRDCILILSCNLCRAWQEVPVLVIVSMLAYFCFLEQLLVRQYKFSAVNLRVLRDSHKFSVSIQVANMGTKAIVMSLPFSCILGLLSSVTSSTMGKPTTIPKDRHLYNFFIEII